MDFLRKIFFYFFLLLYLLVLPLVLLYNLGYIFPPFAKTIEKTGILFINTIPKDAVIFLGDRKFKNQTPSEMRPLLPGDYTVLLKKSGYQSWSSQVTVKAGKVTELNPVVLVPVKSKEKIILNQSFSTLIPLPQAEALLLSKEEKAENMFIYYLDKNLLQPPFFEETKESVGKKITSQVYQSDHNPTVIIPLKGFFSNEGFYAIKTDGQIPEPINLTDLIPSSFDYLGIPDVDSPFIFTVSENKMQKINVEERGLSPNFVTDVIGAGLSQERLYVLDKNFSLYYLDFEGNHKTLLFGDSEIGEKLFKNAGFVEIIPITEDYFLFKAEEGRFISNLPPYDMGNFKAKGYRYYPKEEALLVWDPTSLGLLSFNLSPTQDIFKANPRIKWLYEHNKNLEQCFLIPKTSYYLFTDQAMIYLLENVIPGKVKVYPLKEKMKNSLIYFDEKRWLIYYLDSKTGYLSAFRFGDKNE